MRSIPVQSLFSPKAAVALPRLAATRRISLTTATCRTPLIVDVLTTVKDSARHWAAARRTVTAWLCVPLLSCASFSSIVSAADIPAPPPTGSCTDCIGEFNGTLNDCTLSSLSCVSTQNDDELHFMAPWQYNSSTAEAIDELVAVATGGSFEPALLQQPFGISRIDALGFIVKGFQAAVTGNPPPEKPKFQQETAMQAFDGVLGDRHKTADGSAEYVHLIFGAQSVDARNDSKAANVIDAEFLFLSDDNIVDIRASSRGRPGQSDGQVSLSLSKGLVYDQNIAQRQLERLRKAMQWESVPVITGFDPRYNQSQPLFFEKLYQPFLPKGQRTTFADDGPR